MISAISMIARAALAVALLFLGVRKLKRWGLRPAVWVLFAIFLAGGGALAEHLYEAFRPITDSVTLTALGSSPAASEEIAAAEGADEVFFTQYVVDRTDYEPGKSLKITAGKWFWCGEYYCWRPETDYRQPDGMTDSVSFKIPAGQERQLYFQSGQWWGRVQIALGDDVQELDTYSPEDGEVCAELPASGAGKLMLSLICRLAAFGAALSLIAAAALYVVKKELVDRTGSDRRGWAIYALIALVTEVVMLYWCDRWSMWIDEMLQISFSYHGIREAIRNCLIMTDVTPPLFSILFALWYRIAPYGHQFLYLLPVGLTCGAILLAGMAGEKVRGIHCGVLSAFVLATVHATWIHCAFEIRAYPLVLFLSVLAIYLYIRRNEKPTKKSTLLFSVCLTALAMSHYFGYLACVGFGLSDLCLRAKKRITTRTLITSYILPGLTGALWLAAVYAVTLKNTSTAAIASWYIVPTLNDANELLRFLTGYFAPLYYILLLGMAVSAVQVFFAGGFSWEQYYRAFFAAVIGGTIALLVVYGRWINRTSTMWEMRYFIFLLPFAALTVACTADSVISRLLTVGYGARQRSIVCTFAAIVLGVNCLVTVPNFPTGMHEERYREAADWIYQQVNWIFNDDTIIIGTGSPDNGVTYGWDEYYVTRQGRRDALNVQRQLDVTPEALKENYKVYVQHIRGELEPELQSVLDQDYVLEEDHPDIKVRVYQKK